MEFKEYRLEELCSKIGDGIHGTPKYDENGDYYFINGNNLLNGRILIKSDTKKVNEKEFEKHKRKLTDRTLLISINGTLGNIAKYNGEPCMLGKSACYINVDSKYNVDYLKYVFISNEFQTYLKYSANGTTIKNVPLSAVRNFVVRIPSINNQNKIAKILSDIDSKIEVNNKINDNLQKISQELYKRWFVDFEFPNEEGKPYKSSGGKMIESELGLIPEGWGVKKLKDFFPIITGKKDANASSKNGKYPFFTCGQTVSRIDEFSFDGSSILVSGNGDFNVKFYRGKFDAYQRTYVLIPYDERLLGYLYQLISSELHNITSGHRGSVIKFITKGHIENYVIPFKNDLEIFGIIETLLLNVEAKNKENESLINLRDNLLPKLMNGEIDLNTIEI